MDGLDLAFVVAGSPSEAMDRIPLRLEGESTDGPCYLVYARPDVLRKNRLEKWDGNPTP